MLHLRRRALLAGTATLATPGLMAQGAYPGGGSVAVVIPYGAGGASDVVGRLVTQGLQEKLGGAFVMDHKPGASTSIAARHVARARPDGMTLLLGTIATFTLTPLAMRNPGYDPLNDFEHVTQVCETLSLLVAHPRWTSLEQLLAAAKERPDSISYATWGVGTTAHLPMLDLATRAGVSMLHVPYNGAPPALTDTIAGRTDCMFALLAACKGHLEGGRLRGIAVPTATRPPQLPEVPTFVERGFEGFTWGGWYSVQAPKGTPAPVLERLRAALTEIFSAPRTIEFMAGQGLAPAMMGEAPLRQRIIRETPLHRDLMRRAGLEPN